MAKRGRPTVLDPLRREQLCRFVKAGLSKWRAALLMGIGKATIGRALARDPSFVEQLRQAELAREVNPLIGLRNSCSWEAAAYVLEREHPELYGRRKPDTVPLGDLDAIFNGLLNLVLREANTEEDHRRLTANFEKLYKQLGGRKRPGGRRRRPNNDKARKEDDDED